MDFKRLMFLENADIVPSELDCNGTGSIKGLRNLRNPYFLVLYSGEWFIAEKNNSGHILCAFSMSGIIVSTLYTP